MNIGQSEKAVACGNLRLPFHYRKQHVYVGYTTVYCVLEIRLSHVDLEYPVKVIHGEGMIKRKFNTIRIKAEYIMFLQNSWICVRKRISKPDVALRYFWQKQRLRVAA